MVIGLVGWLVDLVGWVGYLVICLVGCVGWLTLVLFHFSELKIKPRAFCSLDKHSTAEANSQALVSLF